MTTKPQVFASADPPASIIQSETIGFLAQYLRKTGVTRGGFDPEEKGDSRPIPQVTMPGYIHLALSQMASHRLTPYAGNVSAMIRDLIYLGIGAYAQVIADYDQGPEVQLAAHVIRQEEALRRDVYIRLVGIQQAYSIVGVGTLVDLARQAGDGAAVHDQLLRLFHHIDELPAQIWKYQMLRLAWGTPEIRQALAWLSKHPRWRNDDEVTGWTQRMDDIAEQEGREARERGEQGEQ